MSQTLVALYEHLDDARRVVKALTDAGIQNEKISLVAPDPNKEHATILEQQEEIEDDDERGAAAQGAIAGGAIGAIAGLLFGVTAFTIPGLGPILIAGPIYTTVFGAGAGALSGGLIGALVEAGVPEEDAVYYREGVRRGNVLVAVEVDSEERPSVMHIMNAHDPLDVETAAEEWRVEGWQGQDKSAPQFIPGEEDEEAENRYPLGAMGEDMYGEEAGRDQPPLQSHVDHVEQDLEAAEEEDNQRREVDDGR